MTQGATVGNKQDSANPYSTDEPVVDEAGFFGRDREIAQVVDILSARDTRRVVVVQGSHRIGKTSFVRRVLGLLPQKAFLIDLSAAEDEGLGHTLWRAAAAITSSVRDETGRSLADPELNDFLSDASHFHDSFLPTIYKALGRRRLVLAFDGLEAPEGDGDLAKQGVYAYLAVLMGSDLNLSLLLAVEDWPDSVAALFAEVYRVNLGPLGDAAATDLIVESARGLVDFDYQAVRRILDLSSGHPHFVKLLSRLVFDRCTIKKRASEKDVEAVVEETVELVAPYVEHLWDRLSVNARTVLAALASLRGARGILLEQDLRYALKRRGAGLSFSEIADACQELVDKDVLERLGAMSYKFRVELVRLWLNTRRGLDSVLQVRRTQQVATTAGDWVGRFLWPLIGLLAGTAILFWCLVSWQPLRDGNQAVPTPEETEQSSSLSYTLVTPTADVRFTPTAIPTPPAPTLDIAYVQFQEDTQSWDIYAMSRDGSLVNRITDNEVDDSSPVWSGDHRWMVFVSKRDGNQEIYRVDADGSGLVNLTQNGAADWTPSISPDGTKVVFSSLRDGNWELYMMDSDGSQPARMTFNQEPDYSPVWSPDSSMLAFVSERDGNLEIYVMDADGAHESRLTFNDALDLSPSWSPDGTSIAFESYRDGNMEVYVMNSDGTEQRNLTNYPAADDHGPSWSEDGLGIVFYSNRDGNWDLYLMNPQGGEVTNLTNSPSAEQEPFWGS
jgi:DNA-binding transcriptional ArsR family regulator